MGAGLCTVIEMPNGEFVIYDAGGAHTNRGKEAFQSIQEIIPIDKPIETVIISHTDADHLYAIDDVLRLYDVKNIITTGYSKKQAYKDIKGKEKANTKTYGYVMAAIDREGAKVVNFNKDNLDYSSLPSKQYGEATVTFLSGFGKPKASWNLHSTSHALNSVSIVMKVEYKGKSVLFSGDAVGKHGNGNNPIATEKYLMDQHRQELKSDVMIAPHHGADNASSLDFIQAIRPTYVVFSCGKAYNHPRKKAVYRYLKMNVLKENIFKTDRGSCASSEKEWQGQENSSCEDSIGDDDIQIVVTPEGELKIGYTDI